MELMNQTVKNLRQSLDRREISARELALEYLDLIGELNPALQALAGVYDEGEVLACAENAQKLIDKGNASALTGIPAAISDNILTSGRATSCASKMLENFIPPFDADVIETLKETECVILGKTVMDEFGIGHSPKSGAAVGAGLAVFALGTDTGGALGQSAAFNGLTGLRPTYGRVSRFGLASFASSLDQIGPIAQTAEDCAMILNVISNPDKRDAVCFGRNNRGQAEDFTAKIGAGVKGLKIAVPEQFLNHQTISEQTKNAVLDAAKEFENQGAVLINSAFERASKTEMFDYAVPAYYIISSAEASSNLSRYDGVNYGLRGVGETYYEQIADSRGRGFGDEVKRRILFGNFVLSDNNYNNYFKKALALRQKIKAEYDEIFKTVDIILTPTLPKISETFDYSDPASMYHTDICTIPPALAGLPSASTTCGYTTCGLPIGMTLTGKKSDEQTVLQVADCFERIFNPDL